jgi:acyl-CoA reductase-like NAD-dependent aldehyde dehydrogenase
VFGAFAHQGQICMSTERVIVEETVADEFAAKLARRVAALPTGDPRKGDVVLGSVVGQATVDRVQTLVKDAVSKGAIVLTGGEAEGTVMKGVVVNHVTPEMTLFRQESFGPQVSITRARSADEAITLANDTEYGLAAALFTRDIARGLELARRIDTGICHINGPTVHDEAQMPFGGVKSSGYGRFGGKAGIDAFTELRWITVQTTPRHYPF